jgi:SAM-dependent methyltransferase
VRVPVALVDLAGMSQPSHTDRPRRLVFGEVAGLYDRARPGYPASLIDDLVTWAQPGARALEIGAGTGKATRLLAARGVSVLGIEPSAEMAAYARVATAPLGNVEIVESDFERWHPDGVTFPLAYAAQAWHWVDQESGYAHVRAALAPGGHLVAFWNRPAWGDTELRAALSDAYRRTVPELPPDGPMHPDNPGVAGADESWARAIAATDGLTDPSERLYQWSLDYSTDRYVELLGTMSEVRLLGDADRQALLEAVGETIKRHGGRLTMPMATRASAARAI